LQQKAQQEAAQNKRVEQTEPLNGHEFGCLKGQILMADDFDAPLEDFKDYM